MKTTIYLSGKQWWNIAILSEWYVNTEKAKTLVPGYLLTRFYEHFDFATLEQSSDKKIPIQFSMVLTNLLELSIKAYLSFFDSEQQDLDNTHMYFDKNILDTAKLLQLLLED